MACSSCGADVRPDDKFCEGCGNPLHEGSAPAAAPAMHCRCGGTQFDGGGYCLECGQKLRPLAPVESEAVDAALAWATHPGRNHVENQDAVAVRRLADGTVLLAVADGVSSADRAREASTLVVQAVVDELEMGLSSYGNDALRITLQRAHATLCQLPREDMRRDDPQATIVAAVVRGGQVRYAWVGDSRIYALGAEEARQLTEDDSWLNEALRAGIPHDVAVHDRNAHCITQCLGMREAVPEIHQDQVELTPGSWLVLCTDGLWNYFSEPTTLMARVLAHVADGPAEAMCESWVEQANAAGGVDNITVAALRVR